jgi:acyl carrier protein
MDTTQQQSIVGSQEQIFATVKKFLGEIIGEDFIDQYDITMDSTLTGDLEMESIEIVEFSEKIKKHYGSKVDFTNWMSNLELEQIINLTVKDIVNYISQCRL